VRQYVRKTRRATTDRLGTYGERVGRERAARRRAARERTASEQVPKDRDHAEAPVPSEPETIEIPQSDLANELSVLAALIMAGLVRSHPEARRRFRDDGIKVNDVPLLSDKAKLCQSDVSSDGLIRLSLGAQSVLLRPV
jgi:tyrosyl-tRNA synthetase